MIEWSTDTKTGYDDLEVYMEYGYVFVSSTVRNHVNMAAFSFNYSDLSRILLQETIVPTYDCTYMKCWHFMYILFEETHVISTAYYYIVRYNAFFMP